MYWAIIVPPGFLQWADGSLELPVVLPSLPPPHGAGPSEVGESEVSTQKNTEQIGGGSLSPSIHLRKLKCLKLILAVLLKLFSQLRILINSCFSLELI